MRCLPGVTRTTDKSLPSCKLAEEDFFFNPTTVPDDDDNLLAVTVNDLGFKQKHFQMLSKLITFSQKYPVVRGMISYACIWPLGCSIQQKIAGQDHIDFSQCFRFALYGSCFVAPTLYMWVKVSSRLWPATSFKTAVKKAIIEQFTYGPAALACFFCGMTLLEGGTITNAIHEVRMKFFDTYMIGICVWPILQTINFAFVPESNRVIFVSICSLMWTSFLAYMKQLEVKKNHVKHNS